MSPLLCWCPRVLSDACPLPNLLNCFCLLFPEIRKTQSLRTSSCFPFVTPLPPYFCSGRDLKFLKTLVVMVLVSLCRSDSLLFLSLRLGGDYEDSRGGGTVQPAILTRSDPFSGFASLLLSSSWPFVPPPSQSGRRHTLLVAFLLYQVEANFPGVPGS